MTLATDKRQRNLAFGIALFSTFAASALPALAQSGQTPTPLYPNNLVVSRSVYDNKSSNVIPGTILPPNCAQTTGGCGASSGAPDNGTYPFVFNNDSYDGSFGITSRIYLDQLDLTGGRYASIEVPNGDEGLSSTADHLVTSFSSKSELALNLSTDGKYLTFMGYVAPVNTLDVSNSNTPLAIDSTNPDGQTPYYRAIAKVGNDGKFTFTETNAYSGNNGRAAILNNSNGSDFYYTAGNAGNGANPQPNGVIFGAGAQIVSPSTSTETEQTPGLPTPVGSFSITALGDKADKNGKDDNFRGMTVFDDVLYYTKGSGGNGVNTVYFVDTTGTACPTGVGLPVKGAALPTAPLAYMSPTSAPTVAGASSISRTAGGQIAESTPGGFAITETTPPGITVNSDGAQGVTENVSIFGMYTNLGADSVVSFGPSVTVNSVQPLFNRQAGIYLFVNITVQPDAPIGPQTVTVTTGMQVLTTVFNIISGAPAVLPTNMCILKGFPTSLAKTDTTFFPFGLWFANPTTLYVADEGDGYAGGPDLYTHAAAQTTAGLQKWIFNSSTQSWNLAYVLQNNLGLGQPRHLANFPDGINSATGLSWEPATDGLRNITGLVGPDGLVGIWGITSTVSGNGDQGADPNKLVVAIDILPNTNAAIGATLPFYEVEDAQAGEVLRGVSFTPGTDLSYFTHSH